MGKKDDNKTCQENIDYRADQAAAMLRAAQEAEAQGDHDLAARNRSHMDNMLDGVSFWRGRRQD